MNYLAIQIGYAVIGFAFLAVVIWLMSHSPILRWLIKVAALSGWGLFAVGGVLFVILKIHLPQGHYGIALATLLVGAFMNVPWFIVGLPELKKCFADKQERRFVVWE